jgi:hypothetical protein
VAVVLNTKIIVAEDNWVPRPDKRGESGEGGYLDRNTKAVSTQQRPVR